MFEKFNVKDYDAELSDQDKKDINESTRGTTNRDCIIRDYIETSRTLAEMSHRLECLKKYMASIDKKPIVTYIQISKNRHFTALTVSVCRVPKGFEGPLYCNLRSTETDSKSFEGKDKKAAFDHAINLVKAHPGSTIITQGDIYPADLPARVRPFSNYTYDPPKKAVKP